MSTLRATAGTRKRLWTSQIQSGESEYSIALGFAASPEREAIVVGKDYQTYLGRSPSQLEVNYWVDQFVNHGQRNEDVIAGFIGSPEYYNDPNQGAGNAATWLDRVFKELYQREPTESESSSWLSQLGQGGSITLIALTINATAESTTQVNLSCDAVSGAAGYVINELANGVWQQIDQVDSGTTSQTITEMTPGTTYTFEVGAYNSAGTVWSNPISVTTNPALTAPSVNVSAVSTTQATLSWNSVPGAEGYLIDQLVNGASQQIGQYGSGTISETITQMTPGTTYQFEVGAYNSAGTVWSNPINVTTSVADWFSQNLPDTAIQDMARSDFQQHQSITRNDMLQIFAEVEQQGAVTASELTSLQNLVNDSLSLHMPDYVFELADKVVNSDPANRFCATPSNPSGNLYPGAPAADLALLVSDWFLGEGSISWPGTASSGFANGTLFGSAGPQYTDVYQGTLGDCTLMASLAEVAARQPDLIRDMFIANGDGTYAVRLFVNGAQDYVTVNDDLPGYGQEYARVVDGVLWPALLEKAIVEENESGMLATLSPGSNSYSAINDGNAQTTIAYLGAITGWSSGQFAVSPDNIATAWKDGDLIVLGTGNTPAPEYIEHNHAYAMIGYNPSLNDPFVLFNPWGIAGGKDTSGQFYLGQIQANGAALDDYFTFAADASSAAATGPQAIPPSTVAGPTSGACPEAWNANETAVVTPTATTPELAARDHVFSTW